MSQAKYSQGFTLIEAIVTIVVASIIIVGLLTSMATIFGISAGSAQRTKASNLAYANMRLYADGTPPVWFECDTSNQKKIYPVLEKIDQQDGLPGDVTQKVTAQAVYGCADADNRQGFPIKVTSSVQLENGKLISHATYAGF